MSRFVTTLDCAAFYFVIFYSVVSVVRLNAVQVACREYRIARSQIGSDAGWPWKLMGLLKFTVAFPLSCLVNMYPAALFTLPPTYYVGT